MKSKRSNRTQQHDRELTSEELEQETGSELPEREAMSIIASPGAPIGIPVGANLGGPIHPMPPVSGPMPPTEGPQPL